MTEASESSMGLNSGNLGQNVATLSPEDIAWADSCLSTDGDLLDRGWNSLKAALLDTLDSQNLSSPHERENSSEEVKMEITSTLSSPYERENSSEVKMDITSTGNMGNPFNVEEKTSIQYQSSPFDRNKEALVLQPPLDEINSIDLNDIHITYNTPVSIASTSDGPESGTDDHSTNENAEDFWAKHKIEDIFLPTYNENSRVIDPEVDFVFQEFQSSEGIFKIWDFDIPPEVNDLTKQLDKALSEDPLEAWNGVQDDSLNDVISRIADLALSPKAVDSFDL